MNRRSYLQHLSWSGLGLLSPANFWKSIFLKQDVLEGKHPDLVVLNDRPINAETPAHLLNDAITPQNLFFVRNNGIPPMVTEEMLKQWTLTIEGESAVQPKVLTLEDLKNNFQQHTLQLTLECGGNGRKEFNPPAKGNQWSTGAVGCASWTGVRLKDVLEFAGLKDDAQYIGYYGKTPTSTGAISPPFPAESPYPRR